MWHTSSFSAECFGVDAFTYLSHGVRTTRCDGMKKTLQYLREKQRNNVPIVMLTSYDYPTAVLEDECGVDIQLIGDSVGTNVLGYTDIAQVSVDDIVHHVAAVARGVTRSYVLADMPQGSCETPEAALHNARRMIEAGADGVKMEGEQVTAQIQTLVQHDIEVCAHIGYTPQSHGPRARVQGKDTRRIKELFACAHQVAHAGASMIVLELVVEEVAAEITRRLTIPTIGIGSGRFCSGQVQVIHDITGMSSRLFSHARAYCNGRETIRTAIGAYVSDTAQRVFPAEEHVRHLQRPIQWDTVLPPHNE